MSLALQAKIASILVHTEEALGPGGHDFDLTALRILLNDPEVQVWMEGMQNLALLPVRRS